MKYRCRIRICLPNERAVAASRNEALSFMVDILTGVQFIPPDYRHNPIPLGIRLLTIV